MCLSESLRRAESTQYFQKSQRKNKNYMPLCSERHVALITPRGAQRPHGEAWSADISIRVAQGENTLLHICTKENLRLPFKRFEYDTVRHNVLLCHIVRYLLPPWTTRNKCTCLQLPISLNQHCEQASSTFLVYALQSLSGLNKNECHPLFQFQK